MVEEKRKAGRPKGSQNEIVVDITPTRTHPFKPVAKISHGGRPREYDREVMAEMLLEWAQRPESVDIKGFCAEYFINPEVVMQYGSKDPVFHQAYVLAKCILGYKRDELVSDDLLHTSVYNQALCVYDPFVNEHQEKRLRFEHELTKEQLNQLAPELQQSYTALMEQLKQIQAQAKLKLKK